MITSNQPRIKINNCQTTTTDSKTNFPNDLQSTSRQIDNNKKHA